MAHERQNSNVTCVYLSRDMPLLHCIIEEKDYEFSDILCTIINGKTAPLPPSLPLPPSPSPLPFFSGLRDVVRERLVEKGPFQLSFTLTYTRTVV